MAALNFPTSPSTNQIYAANGKSWRFDGTSWKTFFILNVQGGGTGNTFYNLGDILVGAGTSLFPLPVGSNNFVLTADNTAAFGITWRSTAATGITTLNSLTATSQFFSIGYSGNFPSVSSSGSTHTFNIPIAGTGATGLVSTLAQSFAGIKTFTNDLVVSSSTISTSTSTGALTVTGGVGIGGSLFVTSSLPSNLSGIVVNNGVITSGAWAGSTITAFYGGTGLTAINAGNAFLSSNSGGSGLTYRTFVAGSGISFSIDTSSVTFTASGTVSGSGTSAYVPLWTSGGTALTDSIIQQIGNVVAVAGSIKAQTKSFKIQHPLDPNKYLEHGSLEGPEHGIYQRGRASGKGTVQVDLPDYFQVLSENDITVHITSRIPSSLYVLESNSKFFKVKRIKSNFLGNEYIEFDYFVIGERTDIKLLIEQPRQ